jgi:hypothetical protein
LEAGAFTRERARSPKQNPHPCILPLPKSPRLLWHPP